MDGPNYRHLDRRKRDIYKQYLDYSNRKVSNERIHFNLSICIKVPFLWTFRTNKNE